MSEISAYEKMLKDGTAFKKIDMNRIAAQLYSQAEGGLVDKPLGDPIKENQNQNSGLEEDHTDWSAVDEAMQRRMNALKEKMKGSEKKSTNELTEITKLKKRIEKLEEALMLVMETHEKLLR
jgi:peptidoglycan hydrolase CwlO-like protein